MDEKNRDFKVFNKDKEIELTIKNPGLKDREEAESIRIKTWNRAIADGAPFAENLDNVLRKQGLWTDAKQEKLNSYREELAEIFDRLDKGGIKLSDAKKDALRARELRNKINEISLDRVKYSSTTVEGLSSDKEFQYLISCMVYYKNEPNKRYYKDYNDYLNRAGDLDSYLISGKVAEILYGGSEDNWAENKFLKEQGFVDDQYRLINSDGHLIDEEGRLINEFGSYVKYDESGKAIVIDKDGQPLELKVERKPFLDDEGNEISSK